MTLFRKLTKVDKRRPRESLDSRIMPHSGVSNLSVGRIVLGYAVVSILWIAFSDALVTYLELPPAVMTIKGTAFVFVTASLLYFTIRRLVRAVQLTSKERDETANLYRTVVEASNEGICLLDKSERISFLNGRLAAMLGRPAEELQGKRLQDLIEKPHVPVQQGARQSETSECRLRNDSDPKPWVLISRHPVLNDAGEAVQLVCTVIDITERKRAEEALALRSFALNNAHEAVFFIDEQARFLYVNEECCRSLGYTREKLLGMGAPDIDLDFTEESWPDHWRTLRAKRFLNFESHHRTKDGRFFPVEVSAKYLEYGGRAFNLAVARDITERKRAEGELRRSEAFLAEAQRLSHTGSWYLDVGENRLSWSDEVFRIFGIQFGTPLTYETFLAAVHTDDRALVDHAWKEALLGAVYDIEHRIVVGREVRWVRERAKLEFDAEGRAARGIGTVQDITERKHAEEALRERADLLNLTHDTVFVTDMKGVIKYWNRGAEEQYGWNGEQAVGKVVHQMLNTIFPSPLEEIKAEVTRTGRWEGELLHTRKDGTQLVVASRWALRRDEQGAPLAILETNNDITERKRTEEALRQSEAYLTEAQRLTHTGSWALDIASDRYVYASEEFLRVFGFDPQEVLPAREVVLRRIHPDDSETVNRSFEKVVHEKVDTSNEFRIVLPDGAVKTLQATWHPVLNSAGDVVKLLGTAVDITQHKQAEEAQRESETRFRTFVDHAGDALFILDFDQGTVVDVNRQACDSLGYTRQELVGATPLVFDVNVDRAALESVAQRTAAGETGLFDRHWHRRKDGSLFPVEVHTSVFWYGGRRFLLKVARDIGDRLRAEEQRDRLCQLEAELAHINRVSMMGELAASIAHEVNQPLSGIVSNGSACLRWLAGDPPNVEEVRDAVRDIVRDGKRAGEVIARIRALTKRTAPPKEKLDLNETIREVLALVGDEARKNRVTIRTRFADDLPILGDRVQLQQVVLNLVMNAIEAMSGVAERPRQLVIITKNIDTDQLQVTVEDSGTGLDPNTIPRIFDPFYTTKPGGMGMGLSISRSILQNHAGRLWAAANDGPGTSFHFTLPKYHEEKSDAAGAGA